LVINSTAVPRGSPNILPSAGKETPFNHGLSKKKPVQYHIDECLFRHGFVGSGVWVFKIAINTALTILTATLFTRDFLHTKELRPGLHRFSSILIGWGILVFVLVFTPFQYRH